jgi:hypothetical protein
MPSIRQMQTLTALTAKHRKEALSENRDDSTADDADGRRFRKCQNHLRKSAHSAVKPTLRGREQYLGGKPRQFLFPARAPWLDVTRDMPVPMTPGLRRYRASMACSWVIKLW